MQLLATKVLAAGFAVSMAIGGNTTAQMPKATASPAVTYPQNRTTTLAFYAEGENFVSLYDKPTVRSVVKANQFSFDSWLKKLIFLESEGRDDIKILDHNGEHSFGCLQFQMDTFKEFGLKYKLISENDQLDEVIYNCALQKEIAKRMLKENPDNWRKWYTSVIIKGLGLPPKEEQPVLLSLK